jgi:hypothetical protein
MEGEGPGVDDNRGWPSRIRGRSGRAVALCCVGPVGG